MAENNNMNATNNENATVNQNPAPEQPKQAEQPQKPVKELVPMKVGPAIMMVSPGFKKWCGRIFKGALVIGAAAGGAAVATKITGNQKDAVIRSKTNEIDRLSAALAEAQTPKLVDSISETVKDVVPTIVDSVAETVD